MQTFKIHGRSFRACNSGCADCFRTDRRMGLIYGPSAIEDNGRITLHDREPWSMLADCCAYCGADAPTSQEA